MTRFIVALFLVFMPHMVLAQTGSNKTTTQLNAEVNSLWPDNSSGLITPFNSRQTLLDIIASTASGAANVLYATNFSGATVGDKISACVAAITGEGGVCDARGVPDRGTIPAITLSKSGAVLLLPCGITFVSGTIDITSVSGVSGFSMIGCNTSVANLVGTALIWAGNNTDPFLRLRGVRDSNFERFGIFSNNSTPLAVAIRSETVTGLSNTANNFYKISMNGTSGNGLTKGMQWCTGNDCGGSGTDANNDLNYIDSVSVINYVNCAFSIEHGQSKTHTFINSQFVTGQRGVCTTQAASGPNNSGSFRWFGGAGGSNTVADFDLGSADDSIVIIGCNFENSNRLLQQPNATSSPWPITIQGCRWAANGLNADNLVVNYANSGVLTLINNTIDGVSAPKTPQFKIQNGTLSVGVAIGNVVFSTTPTAATNPFVGSPNGWNLSGNIVTNGGGTNFSVPNFTYNQIASGASIPTIANGACGAAANGAVVAGSTDQSGNITIGGAATATCTVVFSATRGVAPRNCWLQPTNAAAAAIGTTGAYVSSVTTAQFVITGTLAGANYGYTCL